MQFSKVQIEINISLHIPPRITSIFPEHKIESIVNAQKFTLTYIGHNYYSLYFTKSPSSSEELEGHVSAVARNLFVSAIPHSLSVTACNSITEHAREGVERTSHYLFWFSEDLKEQRFIYQKIPLRPEDVYIGSAYNIKKSVSQAMDLFKKLEEYHRLCHAQADFLEVIKAQKLLDN